MSTGAIENLTAAINTLIGVLQSNPGAVAATPAVAAAATPAAAPTPTPANVTADQLLELIQPHVSNEAIKAALGVAMRANGVNALPEAQPAQIPVLYAAFQQVLATFGIGGAAPAQAANTSII